MKIVNSCLKRLKNVFKPLILELEMEYREADVCWDLNSRGRLKNHKLSSPPPFLPM